jgi:hypothetical protein
MGSIGAGSFWVNGYHHFAQHSLSVNRRIGFQGWRLPLSTGSIVYGMYWWDVGFTPVGVFSAWFDWRSFVGLRGRLDLENAVR